MKSNNSPKSGSSFPRFGAWGKKPWVVPYSRVRGGTVPTLDISERAFIERIVARDGLKFAFKVWLAVRVALSLWGALVFWVAPEQQFQDIHRDNPTVAIPGDNIYGYAVGIWNIYDTSHYITIAEHGYGYDPGYLTAFFPGFPLLIRIASIFTLGNTLLAAIMVANVCAFVFFWYLYRLVEADYGEAVAKRAVILSAVFPTSFFLFLGYTEAPLLAFTVGALYYGRQQKWWVAGIFAGAAALIKQPGVFLIIPLGYMYWRQYVAYNKSSSFLNKLEWSWLLLCPIAAGGYTIYRYLYINTPLASPNDLGAGELIAFPSVPLLNALRAVRPDNPQLAFNLMEIGFTLLLIGLVVGTVLKIRSATYSLYSVVLAVVSLCVTLPSVTRPETDIPRRILLIFPIFIYLALITSKRRVFVYTVTFSFLLFLCLAGLEEIWIFIS